MRKNEKELSSEIEHLKLVQTLGTAPTKARAEPLIVVDSDQALPQQLLESSPEALRKLARKESADLGTAVRTTPPLLRPHPRSSLRLRTNLAPTPQTSPALLCPQLLQPHPQPQL